jgi:hypothetical protein
MTAQSIAGEPVQAEGRRVGAPDDDRAGLAEIGDHRAVFRSDEVFLDRQSVGGRISRLVDIFLDRHRHPCERARVLAIRNPRIECPGGIARLVRHFGDHGVDRRID